ncbi:MAG TPA: GatB/YqeY domain-containing protein [Acidimicrobiales bacterium]
MALIDELRADLTAAMKDRDQVRVSTLRMALAAVTAAETAGATRGTLDDDAVTGVLRTEVKRRNEAAEIYEEAGRTEQAAGERAEAEILGAYLPAQLDDAALDAVVSEVVERLGAAGDPKAMGKVIGAVRGRVGDAADGGRIAAAVKSRLTV